MFILEKLLTMVLLMIFCTLNTSARGDKYIGSVEKGLSKGDVKSISKVFDKTIDITFSENKAVTYSKAQAGAILKRFFAKSAAKDFKIMHRGKSNTNNTLYAIGTLYTNASNYRVYMFFIPKGKEYMLKELRFEKL